MPTIAMTTPAAMDTEPWPRTFTGGLSPALEKLKVRYRRARTAPWLMYRV